MIKLDIKKIYFFSVPLNRRISNLNINLSRHVICAIGDGKHTGNGEGVIYRGTTLSAIRFYKSKILPFIRLHNFKNLSEARTILSDKFAEKNSGIICALDLALWDLEAKSKNKSLKEILKSRKNRIEITEEIFMDQLNLENLNRVRKNGTKFIKIKIGKEILFDYKNIKKILSKFDFRIRADANQYFIPKDLPKLERIFSELKIRELEEPVRRHHIAKVKNKNKIILDESIMSKADLTRALSRGYGIYNIKISRLGGLTRSLDFIKEIEKRGKKIVIGCSEELGIATYALLCLASSVKNLHSTEGLGSDRLKFDIVSPGFNIKNGMVDIPANINFREAKLRFASKKFGFKISEDAKVSWDFLLYELKQDILGKFKNLWIKVTG